MFKNNKWRALALVGALHFTLAITPSSAAQEPPPESPEAAPADEAPAEEAPPVKLKGDVIHMKSGTTLSNVQVLKATIDTYFVEVAEGVEPLELPRDVVDSVDYDDYDPIRERRRQQLFPDAKKAPIPGNIASELVEALRAPIGGEPLLFENMNLEDILTELAARAKVQLKVDRSITQMPAAERRWSLKAPPETTLFEILQDRMLKEFEGKLDLLFEYDTIIVVTQQEAERRRNPDAAQAAPAPATTAPPGLPNFKFPNPPKNPE